MAKPASGLRNSSPIRVPQRAPDVPPVTEDPCACGVYHVVCLPCDRRLGLPWDARTCVASPEARVAAALLGEGAP